MTGIRSWATLPVLLLAIAACEQPPEVRYVTEHFEVAPDFDHPICAGTLAYFERHLKFVESAMARSVPYGERVRFYWITKDLDSWCSDRALGCYYPGTRVIFGSGESVSHEIVHAVLNAEAETNYFLEEAIAEVYSGVGTYRRGQVGSRPSPSELLWLSPADYRFGELDYAVAGHFMAYIDATYGRATTRALAAVVVTAAGPPELEAAFDRFTKTSFEDLVANYEAAARKYYPGLHEDTIAQVDPKRWADVSLRCDREDTLGPLPDGGPGMYRTMRLDLEDPMVVDVELIGPPEVSATFVDVGRERGARVVVDFVHPKLSGMREHPIVRGGEARILDLRAGTHLIVIEQQGYETHDVFLLAQPREFPRTNEPPP